MTDRFAAMEWEHDGPCPTCGQHPDGVPVYRPKHGKAIPADVVQRQLEFSDTRTAEGGAK